MLTAYLSALVAVMAAQATPGPNMMAVGGAALAQGRGTALLVVSGIATGTIVWALVTAFGLGQLFAAFPPLLTVLMFAGGLYLLWLAFAGFRAAWRGGAPSFAPNAERLGRSAAWRRGVLVVLTNPKSALMWSSLSTWLLSAGHSDLAVFGFGPLVALSAMGIYGGYALLFSSRAAGAIYGRFTRFIELLFGVLFGTLGGGLILAAARAAQA